MFEFPPVYIVVTGLVIAFLLWVLVSSFVRQRRMNEREAVRYFPYLMQLIYAFEDAGLRNHRFVASKDHFQVVNAEGHCVFRLVVFRNSATSAITAVQITGAEDKTFRGDFKKGVDAKIGAIDCTLDEHKGHLRMKRHF